VLILGVVTIITMLAVAVVLPHYRDWSTTAMARGEQEVTRLTRARHAIRYHQRTSAALREIQRRLAVLDSTALPGSSASAASTALSDAISEAAEGSGATLGSVQFRRDSATSLHTLTRIGARASVTGDIEAIALFLESLEAGPRLIAVREWGISAASTGQMPGQPETLRLDVLVEGVAKVALPVPPR
jgi:Tfp pilus assembly protein PilO